MSENEENCFEEPRFLLRKSARLHHRSLVEGLFSRGKSIYDGPLRLTYRSLSGEMLENTFCCHVPEGIGKVQVMVTIPKKMRRHAVDRVLMRRRVREAFRLNSLPLRVAVGRSDEMRTLSLGFIYRAKENLPYSEVERRVKRLIALLIRKLRLDSVPEAEEPDQR